MALSLLTVLPTEVQAADTELHVYGTSAEATANGGYSSINDAIDAAEEGTTIYVHSGTYRETVTIDNKNDITLQNYGTDKPQVTGMELLTGWEEATDMPVDGVYVTDAYDIGALEYTQVMTSGTYNDMGKFPNRTIDAMMEPMTEGGGYSMVSNMYKNADEYAHVTFDQDLPDVDLTGAFFRGLIGISGELPMATVMSNEGNEVQIEVSSVTGGMWHSEFDTSYYQFGYAYMMHKNLIDVPGEWFLEDDVMYYMPDPATDIDDLSVEMQVRQYVLDISNSDDIAIEGIHFYGGAASITNVDGYSMNESSMQYLSPLIISSGFSSNTNKNATGIYVYNVTDADFTNSYFAHGWGNAFYLCGTTDNTYFYNCVIEDIGWLGTFTSGINSTAGVLTIDQCTFNENGRFQIRRTESTGDLSNRTDITNSIFKAGMQLGQDAGPLEFTSTGSTNPIDLDGSIIAYNQIFDLHGIPVSSSGSEGQNRQFLQAFYMEDVMDYTVHHNLVYDLGCPEAEAMDVNPKVGVDIDLMYLGPRYNEMADPVNYYNNTAYGYDKTINFWHVEAANAADVGLADGVTGGSMRDGNFINNSFLDGTKSEGGEAVTDGRFEWSYSLKNITATGGDSSVIFDQTRIRLTDADEFAAYIATGHTSQSVYGYDLEDDFIQPDQYNLEFITNLFCGTDAEASELYTDADAFDFTPAEGSPLIDAGTVIPGITAEGDETPDIGAFEGGDQVLYAGATLDVYALLGTQAPITATVSVTEASIDTTAATSTFDVVVDDADGVKAIFITLDISDSFEIVGANGFSAIDFGSGTYMLAYGEGSEDTFTGSNTVAAIITVAGANGATVAITDAMIASTASEDEAALGSDSASSEAAFATFYAYDLNGDGVVNYSDIACIVPFYGSLLGDSVYDAKYDVDGVIGSINSSDYLAIYNYFAS